MADFDCDVLVIGAGIGGLTIAALMAKQGKRVIVLEPSAQAGRQLACFEREGFLFQAMANVSNGFELGGGHERILASLGLLVAKEHLDPGWQMVLPNHRVDFYSERLALLEELQREFPESGKKASNFFKRLDEIEAAFFDVYQHKNFIAPYSLGEKYHYAREVQNKLNRVTDGIQNSGASYYHQFTQDKELKRLLDLATFFYSLHPLESCPSLLTAFIMGIPKRGTVYFPGGTKSLVDALLKYLHKQEVIVKYNSKVSKILLERQLAVGAQLTNGKTIRAKDIIANTSLADLYVNLLADQKIPGKTRKKLDLLLPEWMPFSVYLGVDDEIIPEQMGRNVFLCNDYHKSVGNTNTVFINLSPPNDSKRAPEGKRALTATCYLPYSRWLRNAEYSERKETIKNQIIKELSRLIVFLDEGLDYQEAATPLTYQKHTQAPHGALTGLAHTPTGFGFNGFSNHTAYKHLWILGDDTFPGRGSDLVSIGARNLAQLIAQS